MPGIVSNRGITHPRIGSWWCCIDSGARQEAMGPGLAPIGGSRPPDVGSPTIEEAANLEDGHNRVAKGEGVGFNLRLVITGGVGVRVAAYPRQGFISKGDQNW